MQSEASGAFHRGFGLAALSLYLSMVLALAAAPAAQAQGATPSRAVTVAAGERGAQYFFDPNTLTVPTGQVTITYKNGGLRKHNFSIEALNLKIPDVDQGQSAEMSFNFTTPGTFEYICDLPNHAARGMRGTLTVVAATQATGAPAQPTGAATQPTAASAATQSAAAGGATAQPTRPAATPASTAGSAGTAVSGAATQSGAAGNLPLFISLAIHIPSAVTWLGIALYDVIVIAVPFLTPAQRGGLLYRPRWVVVALIPLILVTGIYQTINNPFSTLTDFASLEALRNTTTYGEALFFKHGFVFLSWALTLALSFWVAPRLVALAEDGPATRSATRVSDPRLPTLVAWANVFACAALVLCVTVMIFQLH